MEGDFGEYLRQSLERFNDALEPEERHEIEELLLHPEVYAEPRFRTLTAALIKIYLARQTQADSNGPN